MMEQEPSTAFYYHEGRWIPSALVLQQTRLVIKNVEVPIVEKEKELLRIDLRDLLIPPPTMRPTSEQSTPLFRIALMGTDHTYVLGFSNQSEADIWRRMLYDKVVTDFYAELKRAEGKAGKSTKGELTEIMNLFNTMAEQLDVNISLNMKRESSTVIPRAQSPPIQRLPSSSNLFSSSPIPSPKSSSRGLSFTVEEPEQSPTSHFEENEAAVIRAQNYARRWLWRRSLSRSGDRMKSPPPPQDKQRDNLVAELVASEQEFLEGTRYILSKCIIPLYEHALQKLLKDLRFDFTLHEKLQAVISSSSELLRSLRSNPLIGKCFAERMTQMTDAFTDYTQTYLKDLERLVQRRKKNSNLRKFLKSLEQEEGSLLPTLLLPPILRMKTYEWTLKQLAKNTAQSHPDHPFINSTCAVIERVNLMNEMNRENAERFEKFSLILHMRSLSPELQTTRDWVREGPVQMILMSGPERCYIHLFSDCIAVARMSQRNNQCEKLIQLSNATVIEGQDTAYIKNTFIVKRKNESHLFGSATLEERNSWIKDIESVIENRPRSPRSRKGSIGKGKSPINQNVVADVPTQLPKLVLETIEKECLVTVHGPDNDGNCSYKPHWGDRFHFKSTSTYPTYNGIRDGDPIADHFSVIIRNNCVFLCIADGCNWGFKARQAAIKATSSFTEYLNSNSKEFRNLQEIAHHLLLAAHEAHNSIIKGYEKDIWSAGTTTLLGGVICKLKNENYGIAFLNIGDCKAFRYCKKDGIVTDITNLNRGNVADATDPGGRIGPFVGEGAPDLRNLKLYYFGLEEGDLVFVCSDGVHDNFDPQQLGKTPKEVDKDFESESWKDLEGKEKAAQVKAKFRSKLMQDILMEQASKGKSITPQVDALIDHCVGVTKNCREYMVANPGTKQPTDYKKFPGKFDHTTLVCFRIGRYDL